MGEFLRKYVSRRLLALSEGEIAALTTSMRQIGVGTPGGAEALAILHQLLYHEWMTGSLSGPLARIKVDEKNCFGMIEWKAVRFLPKRGGRRRGSSHTLPWVGVKRPCRGTASASRPCSEIAGVRKLPAWWPRKAHRCPRPAARFAEKRRLGGSMVRGRR